MKTSTFCFAVLLMISSCRRRSLFVSARNQLLLLYHPHEDIYSLKDSETIKKQLPASSVSKYTHIISLCAVPDEGQADFDHLLFEIHQIVSADSFQSDDNVLRECPQDYEVKPATLYQSNYKAYTVSFMIRTNSTTKEVLQENHLDKTVFPTNYTDENSPISHMYIFWAYFSNEKLQLTETRHRLSVYDGKAGRPKCDKYGVAKANIENIGTFFPDQFYQKKEQRKLKKKFRWPNENEYFVRHQFVPIDDFTDEYSRKATCNYLNMVPVWRTISEKSMRRVEEYIRDVALILPLDSLSVRTIAYGQLKFLSNKCRAKTPKPVFLNMDEDKIPVPRVLIKILSYELPFPISKHKVRPYVTDSYHQERYRVAIVIHNEINTVIQPICKDKFECEEYGWHITDGGEDKNVYCCGMNDGVFHDYGYTNRDYIYFDLNSVPLSDNTDNIMEPLNVFKELENMGKFNRGRLPDYIL